MATMRLLRLALITFCIEGAISSVPWQESRRDLVHEAHYIDLPPTVFAPSGRLHSVEQILPLSIANDPACSAVIAFCTKEGMVVVATRPKSPHLFDPAPNSSDTSQASNHSNHTTLESLLKQAATENNPQGNVFDPPFTYLGPNLLATIAGNSVDAQVIRLLLQDAAETSRSSLTRLTARTAARTLANQLQQRTQLSENGRLLASTAVLMDANELWRVDPTGTFYQCQVAVAGRAADKIHQELIDKLADEMAMDSKRPSGQQLRSFVTDLSINRCLTLATRTMQSIFTTSDKLDANCLMMGVSTTLSRLTKHSNEELLSTCADD